MDRIFKDCLLLAAFVLVPFGAGMASPAAPGQGHATDGKAAQYGALTRPDSPWDLDLLKAALKPLKKEKEGRVNPRAFRPLPKSPQVASKAEEGTDEKPKKDAGKRPADPNAHWFSQGLEYSARNEYDSAIGAFTLALTADHRDASSYYNRAVLHQRCGQYNAAIEDYTKASRIVPNDADLYYNRALAYQCSGDLRRAIDDYGKAIQLNPDDPWPHWNRGLAFSQEGRDDLASTDFCRSFDLAAAHRPARD